MKPSLLYHAIVSLILSCLIVGCNKNDSGKKQTSLPIVETIVVTNITQTSAQSGGNITKDGGTAITNRGICWSTSANPTTGGSKTSDSVGTGAFVSNILGLQPNTQYHLRAFASNSAGTAYGQDVSFTTTQLQVPTITTTVASNITDSSLVTGGTITSDNGAQVISRGVCWSTSASPTIALTSKTNDGNGQGGFTSLVKGLNGGTTYYLRSYATNSIGTAYGNEIIFKTLPTILTLFTSPVTSIGLNSASTGGGYIDSRPYLLSGYVCGVCWNTNPNPTVSLSTKTSIVNVVTNSFVSNITGLSQGTTYYVRAYATNYSGTVYGNELTFTTYAPPPTVTTNSSATSISNTSAVCGGNVVSDGGSYTVTARGVCWSTSSNPNILTNPKTVDGTGLGNFTSTLTSLSEGTTYFVRAYATNAMGTSYGNEISLTTTGRVSLYQSYGGGKVFYIDATGKHGLIVGNELLTADWTNAIESCKNYNSGGYTDWFLPSKDQLDILYHNQWYVGIQTGVGTEIDLTFWSSSQVDANYAYTQNFSNGLQFSYTKNLKLRVIPIRAF